MSPRLLLAALLVSPLLLCVPGSAAAAPWTCEVRFRVGNRHLFRTFTLPPYVDIG